MSLCDTCGYFCGKVGGAILCYWMFLPIQAVPKSGDCPAFIEKSKEER